MKIMLVELGSCGVNYQSKYLTKLISDNLELTKNLEEADTIVMMGGCCCINDTMQQTLDIINYVLENKKSDAVTYLTGCITHGFKDIAELKKVETYLKENIDFIISHYEPNRLLKHLDYEKFKDFLDEDFGMTECTDDFADIYIQNGCNHTCTFCKTNYLNYRLKDVPIEEIKDMIDELDLHQISTIQLRGLNLAQYGLDLYREYKLMELCEYIESKKNIEKVILSGVAIRDAIKGDFANKIKYLEKTKGIICSLESGSNRILELMKKGFTVEEFMKFFDEINSIHKKGSFINIISGFPTETIDECLMTLKVLREINPKLVNVNIYADSEFIPAHNLEVLSSSELREHTKIYKKILKNYGIPYQINGAN